MDPTLSPDELNAFAVMVWTWTLDFAPRLLTALIVLVVGSIIARYASRGVGQLVSGRHVDPTVRPVVVAAVRYAIMVLVIVLTLTNLGIQTASLLAVLGAAGLAIGLALQGTLTNIAAGIMLLWIRPFRVGDYIEVANQNLAGTVREMGLFVCRLETFDGVFLLAPNSTIWNYALRNHSRNEGRLMSVTATIPTAGDWKAAQAALQDFLQKDRRILKNPPPSVFVDGLTDKGTVINCRFYAGHDSFALVQRSIIPAMLDRLSGIGPALVTRVVPPDADPSRLIAIEQNEAAIDQPAAPLALDAERS
jgi:small conductance mechanosensitive channel